MARNEYAHERLSTWALWTHRNRGGGGSFATPSLADRVDGVGYDAPTVISNIDAEAEETDRAVRALEPGQREAVSVVYLMGGRVEAKARRLGVAVATLHARVEKGTHAVARWLDDRQRAAQAERARVEALQRTVHPIPPGLADCVCEPAEATEQSAPTPPGVDRTGSALAAHLAATRAARKGD